MGLDLPKHLTMTEYLQAQWRENLGIDLPWRRVGLDEFGTIIGPSAQKPSLWYVGIDLGVERGDTVPLIEGWYAEGWQNEAYERFREEVRHAVDLEERLRICREADRLLAEEAPTLILLCQRWHLLVNPWVTRLPLAETGGPWWKDVGIEPH